MDAKTSSGLNSRKFKVVPDKKKEEQLPFHPALNLSSVKRIIAVLSGKGGVGKSTVTSLLAVELRRKGYSVGIMDADITGPSIPKMFGITGPLESASVGIFPAVTETGIKVMSTNLLLPEEDTALIWRGPIMSSAIMQFWKDVVWGELDVLLVDLPPGTSDATLTVMQSVPLSGAVMVSMPQKLSTMVVRKTVNMAAKMEIPILGVIENMSYFTMPDGKKSMIFGESNIEKVAELAKAPVLGKMALDPSLSKLEDDGKAETYSGTDFDEIADAFVKILPPERPVDPAEGMQE